MPVRRVMGITTAARHHAASAGYEASTGWRNPSIQGKGIVGSQFKKGPWKNPNRGSVGSPVGNIRAKTYVHTKQRNKAVGVGAAAIGVAGAAYGGKKAYDHFQHAKHGTRDYSMTTGRSSAAKRTLKAV